MKDSELEPRCDQQTQRCCFVVGKKKKKNKTGFNQNAEPDLSLWGSLGSTEQTLRLLTSLIFPVKILNKQKMHVCSSQDVCLTYGIQILPSELSPRNMESRVPEEIGLFDVYYKKRCMFSDVNKNK